MMPGVEQKIIRSVEVFGTPPNLWYRLHFDDTSSAASASGVGLAYVLEPEYRNTPVDVYFGHGGKVIEVVPRLRRDLKRHDHTKTVFERLAEAVWG